MTDLSLDVHPTEHLTYDDISTHIPAMITCLEMLIFAGLFLYAYRAKPYVITVARYASQDGDYNTSPVKGEQAPPQRYYGGFLGIAAIFQAVNITDLLLNMIVVPMELLG